MKSLYLVSLPPSEGIERLPLVYFEACLFFILLSWLTLGIEARFCFGLFFLTHSLDAAGPGASARDLHSKDARLQEYQNARCRGLRVRTSQHPKQESWSRELGLITWYNHGSIEILSLTLLVIHFMLGHC